MPKSLWFDVMQHKPTYTDISRQNLHYLPLAGTAMPATFKIFSFIYFMYTNIEKGQKGKWQPY